MKYYQFLFLISLIFLSVSCNQKKPSESTKIDKQDSNVKDENIIIKVDPIVDDSKIKIENPYTWSEFEWALYQEILEARTQPEKYKIKLINYEKKFDPKNKNDLVISKKKVYALPEGSEAFEEAVEFMENQTPINPLSINIDLSKAAQTHVNDCIKNNIDGHFGSDNSKPIDRVLKYVKREFLKVSGENLAFNIDSAELMVALLIVDPGVEDRGHREIIFNKDMNSVGISCGEHPSQNKFCVFEHAEIIKDKLD